MHALIPLLSAEHEGVRLAASLSLRNLIASCVELDAAALRLTPGKGPSPLQKTIAAVEASLGAQYQEGWAGALPVASELLGRLGRDGAPLAAGLVARLGDICAGAEDAAEEYEDVGGGGRIAVAAREALGAALRSLGPEAVLEVLPLDLEAGLDGTGEVRAWLMPLMRTHVRGARLGYWGSVLLPLAQRLAGRAARAGRVPAGVREAQLCSTLEGQIWGTLPSFCSWAEDAGDAFK
jgi:ribosomal RNA-processing protein 12